MSRGIKKYNYLSFEDFSEKILDLKSKSTKDYEFIKEVIKKLREVKS